MKKLFLLILIAFTVNAKAQFVLEHTYDSAATWNYCAGPASQLMIVDFEVSGERYVKINRCGDQMNIYDMNHTLIKTIPFTGMPHTEFYNQVGTVLYLSELLFDNDPGMEFMYVCDSSTFNTTKIYNDDGSLLFTSNGIPNIMINFIQQQYPIYNTSVGTKMILSYENGQAKVFGLSGTLTTEIAVANEELLNAKTSNPYPNPTSTTTHIDYTLPEGVNNGVIIFYDLQGKEIKRFAVDRTFNNLLISTADIASGTYYYQLQTSKENTKGKKLVVVK